MATTYENLAVRFGAETKDLVKGLNDANRAVKDATAKMDTALRAGQRAFQLLGAAAAAVGVTLSFDFLKRTIDTVGGLGELAQQLGVTTDFLQEFQYAGAQSGITAQDMEQALMKLTRTLKAGQSPQQAFIDLADAISKTSSPSERASLAFEYLGRSGQKLLPILEGGSEAFRNLAIEAHESGAVISKDMIDQADRASDKMAAFSASLEKIAQTIAAKLAPAFHDLATWFENLLNPSLTTRISDLKTQLGQIVDKINELQGRGGSARQRRETNALIENLEGTKAQLEAELATLEARQEAIKRDIAERFKSSGGGLPQTAEAAKAEAKALNDLREQASKARMRDDEEAAKIMEELNRKWEQQAETIRNDLMPAGEKYLQLMRDLQYLREQGYISEDEFVRQREKYREDMYKIGEETKKVDSITRELGMTFTSAFEDAIVSGNSLKDVLKGLMNDITRVLLRTQLIEPMLQAAFGQKSGAGLGGILGAIGSIGSIWGGGIFGGVGTGLGQFDFLAAGGPTTANRPYVVGENGPELFIPSSAGYVSPDGGGVGGVNISYSIDARGADPGVDARIRKAMDETTMRTVALVTSLADRGGSFAQKMGRRA